MRRNGIAFPDQKGFAFSILDDTDDSTVENVRPVYDLLRELGFRTTKTVWAFRSPQKSRRFFAADTLEHPPYREYVHQLVDAGFELGFHGASMESSSRARTVAAFDFLKEEFGAYPRVFCNHGQNRENLYWGHKRFQTVLLRQLYRALQKKAGDYYSGELEGSDYFWGDVCARYITYVRNFTFERLNVLKADPQTPYRLPRTPYVRYWFSTADAPNVEAFNRLVRPDAVDELEKEGGVTIISTHLGKGFVRKGRVDPEVERTMRYLARKEGWFVPVSEILDHLRTERNGRDLGLGRRLLLECRFMLDRIGGLMRRREWRLVAGDRRP